MIKLGRQTLNRNSRRNHIFDIFSTSFSFTCIMQRVSLCFSQIVWSYRWSSFFWKKRVKINIEKYWWLPTVEIKWYGAYWVYDIYYTLLCVRHLSMTVTVWFKNHVRVVNWDNIVNFKFNHRITPMWERIWIPAAAVWVCVCFVGTHSRSYRNSFQTDVPSRHKRAIEKESLTFIRFTWWTWTHATCTQRV